MHGTPSAVMTLTLPRIVSVMVTDDTVSVDLEDGRTIAVPIAGIRVWRMAHQLSAPMCRSAAQGMACIGLISMRISALKDCWLASSRQKVPPHSNDGYSSAKQDNPKKPPNKGLQLTGNSLRSYLAPAIPSS